MTNATWTKLRDGSWGAKTTTPVARGCELRITNRAGEVTTSLVGAVVWTNRKDCWLVSIASEIKGATRRTSPRARRYLPGLSQGYAGAPSYREWEAEARAVAMTPADYAAEARQYDEEGEDYNDPNPGDDGCTPEQLGHGERGYYANRRQHFAGGC